MRNPRSWQGARRGQIAHGLRGAARFTTEERMQRLQAASAQRRYQRIPHDDIVDLVRFERSGGVPARDAAEGLYEPPAVDWTRNRQQLQRVPSSWAPRLFVPTLEQRQARCPAQAPSV